ncbi:MAG: RagB/SusD family nutrient uptake outer membrane protein [Tidjanibacter sp.]|nr:RagB/SusD family nutrient uptake outer membrane protein [Tidjanibacter sp.]
MKKIKYIAAVILGSMLFSCMDLDIPPVNLLTDQAVFTSESGVSAYIAKMYRDMPMEDFLCSPRKGWNDTDGSSGFGSWSGITGEAIARSQRSQSHIHWFSQGYEMLREINVFIETLPEYAENFSESDVNRWLGEAYFLRAFAYHTMAMRYGGVIIVNNVLDYPNPNGSLEDYMLPRSSEEDTWDQVAADFDKAIELLPEWSVSGRANKYVAAAYKARAMLFAASIANFNTISHFDTERHVRLCGIPAERAVDYYKSAYNAAKMLEGHYSLYMDDWKSGDYQSQILNFHNILQNPENCETILLRAFQYDSYVHSWDSLFTPLQTKVEGTVAGASPTLDYVELFDGMERDSEGHIKFLDNNGNYILFDDALSPWTTAEPRLRATVIFPGDEFRGETIEIWRGIYTGAVGSGIVKFLPATSTDKYSKVKTLKMAAKEASVEDYTLATGEVTKTGGGSGSYTSTGYGTLSGFLLRKWMDTSLPINQWIPGRSESDWVDMRYAEIMLIRAEAALELSKLGESGESYTTDAFNQINSIRQRAGATLLSSKSQLTRQFIRDERFRELGFENKAYWDLIRWRTYADEHASKRRYFNAMPFRVSENGKWIYDRKYAETSTNSYTFQTVWYYMTIPDSEIAKNTNLVQNPI